MCFGCVNYVNNSSADCRMGALWTNRWRKPARSLSRSSAKSALLWVASTPRLHDLHPADIFAVFCLWTVFTHWQVFCVCFLCQVIKGLSYLREKHKIMHRGQSVWFNRSVFSCFSSEYLQQNAHLTVISHNRCKDWFTGVEIWMERLCQAAQRALWLCSSLSCGLVCSLSAPLPRCSECLESFFQTSSPQTSWWTPAVRSSCVISEWADSSSTPWPTPSWARGLTCLWVETNMILSPRTCLYARMLVSLQVTPTSFMAAQNNFQHQFNAFYVTVELWSYFPDFLCRAAGAFAGDSLFCSVWYLEHGSLSGGNGHWPFPYPPARC